MQTDFTRALAPRTLYDLCEQKKKCDDDDVKTISTRLCIYPINKNSLDRIQAANEKKHDIHLIHHRTVHKAKKIIILYSYSNSIAKWAHSKDNIQEFYFAVLFFYSMKKMLYLRFTTSQLRSHTVFSIVCNECDVFFGLVFGVLLNIFSLTWKFQSLCDKYAHIA